jgi:hypothetical protein
MAGIARFALGDGGGRLRPRCKGSNYRPHQQDRYRSPDDDCEFERLPMLHCRAPIVPDSDPIRTSLEDLFIDWPWSAQENLSRMIEVSHHKSGQLH